MLGRVAKGALRFATLGYYGAEAKPEPTLNDMLLEAQIENMHKFDEGDQPAPQPATSEIDQLKALLLKESAELLRQREVWAERLRLLAKLDAVHPDHVHQADCTKEMDHNKSALKEFFEKFTEFFHSAKTAMDDQLRQEMDSHVVALEAHLEHLMNKAQEAEGDARRDAHMHICNAAIVMLDELHNLTTNFSSEIAECIKDEQLLEQKAQIMINAGIYYVQNLLNIIIPPVDIEFGEEYLNFLGRELQEPESRYLAGVAQAEGMLDKAARVTEGYLQPHRTELLFNHARQFDGAARKFAGSMTLFAGKAVEKAEDKQFERDLRNFLSM